MSAPVTSTSPTRRRLPLQRDSLLFALGAAGIGYQQWTERYYVPLLIIYALMVGVPGVLQLIHLLWSVSPSPQPGGGTSTPDTPPGPSPPAPSPSLVP